MKIRDAIKLLSKMAGVSLEPRVATGNFITRRSRERSRLLATVSGYSAWNFEQYPQAGRA